MAKKLHHNIDIYAGVVRCNEFALEEFLLFALLFSLTRGIPTAIKFEETNLKLGPANATVRKHHMAFDNTILSFKAKAAPSDVLYEFHWKLSRDVNEFS